MSLIFILTGVLLILYALLIFYYHRIWDSIPAPVFKSPKPVRVSVIIPARNEGKQIGHCLEALLAQDFPSEFTEIIVVNDFSTDDTASVVSRYGNRIQLINLSDHVSAVLNSYKKKAIETGIEYSSGELIVCTDADCTMGPEWLRILVSTVQEKQAVFIAAPVKIKTNGSWLSIFQALDFISLQGITGAAVYGKLYPMCNGANLAYTRKAFYGVGGFTDIDQIASGDDMLLMKKIRLRWPDELVYIKNHCAIVETRPSENIRAFFNQRIRWASKIRNYRDPATFITLAGVYTLNLLLIVLFIGCFFTGHWKWLIVLIAFKTVSEYFFVSRVAAFFEQSKLMKYFLICQPFHILYTVVAGSFGSFGKYEWKNRKVR